MRYVKTHYDLESLKKALDLGKLFFMNRFYYLTILLLFITSCTIQKRLHQPGYHVEWHKKEKNQNNASSPKYKAKPSQEQTALNEPNYDLTVENNENLQTNDLASSTVDLSETLSSTTTIPIINVNNSKDKCDTIIMKNGDRMIVKVKSATSELLSFQKCGDAEKKTYKMDASDVLIIKYANESSEVLGSKKDVQKINVSYKKIETFSALSLALSLVAIFITLFLSVLGGGILSLVSLIFGIVGLSRINKYKDKYKGKGMAIIGTLFSLIGIILSIVFISSILVAIGL